MPVTSCAPQRVEEWLGYGQKTRREISTRRRYHYQMNLVGPVAATLIFLSTASDCLGVSSQGEKLPSTGLFPSIDIELC